MSMILMVWEIKGGFFNSRKFSICVIMLFLFRSKKQFLFNNLVDFHNHILPNVDDGCKSVNHSLEMLDEYYVLGFKEVIPSPHCNELFQNDTKKLKNSFKNFLQDPYVKRHDIKIRKIISEYLISDNFFNNLKKNELLLTFKKKYILIEIPFFGQLNILNDVIFNLKNLGINPILAHPERFAISKNKNFITNLKKQGVLMQLNALSLLGSYGNIARKKATNWLVNGMYDFVCTDAHNLNQLKRLHKIKLNKREIFYWNRIRDNQIKIFN